MKMFLQHEDEEFESPDRLSVIWHKEVKLKRTGAQPWGTPDTTTHTKNITKKKNHIRSHCF